MFEEDKPGCRNRQGTGSGFCDSPGRYRPVKPAALTAPLGRCRSAAFVRGRDHVLESSDLFSTCRHPDASVSRGKMRDTQAQSSLRRQGGSE